MSGRMPGPAALAALAVMCAMASVEAPAQPRTSESRAADDPLALHLAELPPGRPLDRQILVTFADPHGGRINLSGRPGPRYQRRGEYRVSVDVQRAARRVASDFDLETVDEWPIQPLQVYCLVYSVPAGEDIDVLLEALNARQEVESAQRLNVFRTQSGTHAPKYDDPYYDLQHALTTLQLPEAHVWSRGEHVNVGIVDTGADLEHPDLRGRIAAHRDFVRERGGAFSADRHGTALAGIIGAAANNGIGIVGVAPAARLHLLRACWHPAPEATALCTSFTLAQALTHALKSDLQILNLSLAGPADPLLERLLKEALARGMVVVAASPGAEGARLEGAFPAGVAGVIAVELTEKPEAGAKEPARDSIRAPGRDIIVAAPGAAFELASGTSLAAAHVSGVVALLKARYPSLTTQRTLELLAASRTAAHESINACRALATLLGLSGCEPVEASVTQLAPGSMSE